MHEMNCHTDYYSLSDCVMAQTTKADDEVIAGVSLMYVASNP
jgi:hypothetical protein